MSMYDTSLFSGLSGTVEISALGFRKTNSGTHSLSLNDFEIRLSTTTAGSTPTVGQTYDSQHGADVTLVKDGAYSLNVTSNTDYFTVALDTSFVFDTSRVLVMELFSRNNGSGASFAISAFQPSSGPSFARGYSTGTGDTINTQGQDKLTTLQLTYSEFTSIPVPTPLFLFALSAPVLLRLRATR